MFGQAVGDVARIVKLRSGNSKAHHHLSRLHFKTGDRDESLAQIRECVKLDADNKEAFKFYKMLKKFKKVMDKVQSAVNERRFTEAIEYIDTAREIDADKTFVYQDELNTKTCNAYKVLEQQEQAMTACNVALELNPRNVEALLTRAEVWEQKADFEAAIVDIKAAGEIEENSQRVKERLQKAEKLLKQSKKRDYYKILGLPRTAAKKDITKAYRALARKWHPDQHTGEEDKKVAEGMFMDIAAANEVLTDEKMRKQFDQGDDPLDAEQERERNQGGFNPFGGGQRFHFRHG
jgi:DnaJ family protein C protein 3